jgi:hypothetical protein
MGHKGKFIKGVTVTIRNERGIALLMVLVLSTITLAVISGLIYMVTVGTQTSGIQKRYKTSFEAAQGGTDIIEEIIMTRGDYVSINNIINDLKQEGKYNAVYATPETCIPSGSQECMNIRGYNPGHSRLATKLNMPTKCWRGCDSSLIIITDPLDTNTYDVRFQIGTAPNLYNVFAKIVDATKGNSGVASDLVKGTGIVSTKGEVTVPQIVYLYTIEVLAQSAVNPMERAKTSTLFAY